MTQRSAERCLTCGRTDEEYASGDWMCIDPWHSDDHLRAATPAVVEPPAEARPAILDALFSLTDQSNWGNISGDYYRGYRDAMEMVHELADDIAVTYRSPQASPLRGSEKALADFICETKDRLGPGCDELAIAQAILRIYAAPPEQPEYLTGCLHPGHCQRLGMCQSQSCKHAGKVIRPRMCVEPKEAGILYPKVVS